MARRNRRKKQYGRLIPVNLIGLVVVAIGGLMVYLVLEHKCEQYGQWIRDSEQELATLSEQCRREEANWNKLKRPDSLDQALRNHGLKMEAAKPEFTAHIDQHGKVHAMQPFVQRARGNGSIQTGQAK